MLIPVATVGVKNTQRELINTSIKSALRLATDPSVRPSVLPEISTSENINQFPGSSSRSPPGVHRQILRADRPSRNTKPPDLPIARARAASMIIATHSGGRLDRCSVPQGYRDATDSIGDSPHSIFPPLLPPSPPRKFSSNATVFDSLRVTDFARRLHA